MGFDVTSERTPYMSGPVGSLEALYPVTDECFSSYEGGWSEDAGEDDDASVEAEGLLGYDEASGGASGAFIAAASAAEEATSREGPAEEEEEANAPPSACCSSAPPSMTSDAMVRAEQRCASDDLRWSVWHVQAIHMVCMYLCGPLARMRVAARASRAATQRAPATGPEQDGRCAPDAAPPTPLLGLKRNQHLQGEAERGQRRHENTLRLLSSEREWQALADLCIDRSHHWEHETSEVL